MLSIFHLTKGIYFDYTKNILKAIYSYKKSQCNLNIILYRIGTLEQKIKNWTESEYNLRKAVSKGNKNAITFYRLGVSLEKQGKKEEASLFFQQALKRRPGYLPWVEHYLACKEVGSDDSLSDDELALLGTKKADAWHDIASHRLKKFLYYQAIPVFEQALALDSSKGSWWMELALCQEQLGKYEEAEASYLKAKQLGIKTEKLNYRLGLVQEAQGKKKEAAGSYKIACALGRKEARYGGAMLHKADGDWEKVMYAMEDYVRRFPGEDAMAYYTLGMASDFCYRWEQACEAMEEAIALAGEKKRAEWLCRLGMLYERRGKQEEASELYAAAYSLSNKNDISFLLGLSLEKSFEYKKACEAYLKSWNGISLTKTSVAELEKKLARSNFNPNIAWQLGKHLYEAGLYEEACKAFVKTRRIRPFMPYGVSRKKFDEDISFRLKAIYLDILEHDPIQEKCIFYESFLGNTMSCNPYAIFKKLKNSPEYAGYTHVWSINDMSCVPPVYREDENIIFVSRGTDAYMRYLATAKYLINNVTFPGYFIRRKEQIYCNTWHGTPLKCLGDANRYAPYGYANVTRNFLHASWLIQSNQFTNDKMLDFYHVRSILPGQSVVTGYPRQDLMLNMPREEKESLRRLLVGSDDTKKILLYAPTWRDYEPEDVQGARISNILKALTASEYRVIFKGHQFLEKKFRHLGYPTPPAWLDTNELLAAVDVLVTDYSSIGIDFIASGKPAIYYTEDIEQYENGRGLYISEDEFPGIVCRDIDELKKTLAQPLPEIMLKPWQKKLIEFDDGKACERVIDLIFHQTPKIALQKRPVALFYGGTLLANGIWTALVNTINRTINDIDIYITCDLSLLNDAARASILKKLPDNVHVIPHNNDCVKSVEELFSIQKWLKYNHFPSKNIEEYIIKYYKREYTRIFGHSTFDAIINFEGYNINMTAILAACDNAKQKIIYCHSDMFSEYRERHHYLRKIFELYKHYDKIVSVSRATGNLNKSSIAGAFNISPEKFVWIDNMLDDKLVQEKAKEKLEASEEAFFNGSPIFINIGRMSVEKDQAKLIRAFAPVAQQIPATRLLILGDGFLRLNLMTLIKELHLENNVFLLGQKENPYPWLAKADCFVLSSNHEGQPMVLLEAMALNKPIIATDITATRGMLGGTEAELVENNEQALSRALLAACSRMPAPVKLDFEGYNTNCIKKLYSIAGITIN